MRLLFVLVALMIAAAGCSQPQPESGGTPRVIGDSQGNPQAEVHEFSVRAFQWGFDPEKITVKKGEKVRLLLSSTDVNHGLAFPEYGLDVKLSPGQTVPLEFTADKEGTFVGYCSVPCGEGHLGMKLKLVVE